MSTRPLLFRADATTGMGTGHVMRCLALAQAWQDQGGEAVFVSAQATKAIEERLRADNVKVIALAVTSGTAEDAVLTSTAARECGAQWIVVDGYQFDAAYQRLLQQAGLQILCVDDNGGLEHYCADLVLNQNAHAAEELYKNRERTTRLLLGPRYSLLRREFNFWRGLKREISFSARKVLLTMGGSDPENVTAWLLRLLGEVKIQGLEITVVVGGSSQHRVSVETAAARVGAIVKTDVANMSELMACADVAIAAAGTTTWELCFLGVPAILVELADNQARVAQQMQTLGIAKNLGKAYDRSASTFLSLFNEVIASQELRRSMSRSGQALVDGYGASRVCSFVDCEVRLRRAEVKDCKILWTWANDPLTRAVSFSTDAIPWNSHMEWFETQLVDSNALIYIATDAHDEPLGQVRFRLENGRGTVSIGLGAEHRGKGLGVKILNRAVEEVFQKARVREVDAYVKLDNQPSLQLFERAGFREAGSEKVKGVDAIHFVLSRTGALK
jgi:UDP-2,4-diacetamido-2,4,6-trideoxy-beta-L-altropyranose hydrolase